MPPFGSFSSNEVKARRIWVSIVATNTKYDRSSSPTAALKLCLTKLPSGDRTKAANCRYRSDGSANVFKSDMMGGGNVGGNASVV